jgi:hypothetical protein
VALSCTNEVLIVDYDFANHLTMQWVFQTPTMNDMVVGEGKTLNVAGGIGY